ncbi:MAG: helix-turn-helix domain-containing protein [Methanomassiliicoccaceae archaeon]|nr:helix-turn-helix domain-containing protein [Methanomassiliicoccaceae archaeon]
MKIVLYLSKKELTEMISETEHGSQFHMRLFFICLLYSGQTVEEAARSIGVSRSTGYNILKRWNEGGPDTLRPQKIPGRPSKMTDEQSEQIKKILIKKPMETKNVRSLIEQKYGIDYSMKQIHIILVKMGFHHVKPEVERLGRFKNTSNMVWIL